MCQLTSHTGSIQVNLFRCTLSPRPVVNLFPVIFLYYLVLFIIVYLTVFVLYCLLLLSLTILVIQPLGCERDINKLLLLLSILLYYLSVLEQARIDRTDRTCWCSFFVLDNVMKDIALVSHRHECIPVVYIYCSGIFFPAF